MERIWYILIALAAGIIGILLFTLGYSTIRYHRTRGKWLREFWISVAIVLVFLGSSCGTCYAPMPPGKDRVTTVGTLEQQYHLVQDMYEQNKMNQEAFNTTKTDIRRNCKILLESGSLSPQEKERLLKLLNELSKPEPTEPLDKEETRIKKLIEQLGNDNWNIREEATKELIKIGPSIKPYLETALKSENPEIKDRAGQIWQTLEFDIQARVAEIKKTKEWTELREIFTQAIKYMPDNAKPNEKTIAKLKSRQKKLYAHINRMKDANTKDNLLSIKKSLACLLAIAGKAINNSIHPDGLFAPCYMPDLIEPRKNKDYQVQRELLDKKLKQGKITKTVYEKVALTIDRYEIDKQNPSKDTPEYNRTNFIMDNLDALNTRLVFHLLREIHQPVKKE